MEDIIVNKVNQSGLLQIDLEELRPTGDRILLDVTPFLFMGQVVKEKDFRAFVNEHDWAQYSQKHVAIFCSADAIIPTWAYMLITVHLSPYAQTLVFGNLADLEKVLYQNMITHLPTENLEGARVVVKGCSKESIPTDAYVQLSHKLRPIVKSLFFGEPCSTVPIFKRK
ncbi:DUF2480 family protein [Aquirufa sp. ROCK2-A2]